MQNIKKGYAGLMHLGNKDRTKRPWYNDKIKRTNSLDHNGVKLLAQNPCQCKTAGTY